MTLSYLGLREIAGCAKYGHRLYTRRAGAKRIYVIVGIVVS
jgi:hypothetical protein